MKKEQIEILEEALNLLEYNSNELACGAYRCSSCHSYNDCKNNCKLTSTKLNLVNLIEDLKKNA